MYIICSEANVHNIFGMSIIYTSLFVIACHAYTTHMKPKDGAPITGGHSIPSQFCMAILICIYVRVWMKLIHICTSIYKYVCSCRFK